MITRTTLKKMINETFYPYEDGNALTTIGEIVFYPLVVSTRLFVVLVISFIFIFIKDKKSGM